MTQKSLDVNVISINRNTREILKHKINCSSYVIFFNVINIEDMIYAFITSLMSLRVRINRFYHLRNYRPVRVRC